MYLPRNIWFVLVVIMISSCSTETLDVTSPTGKLGVTVKPMEGKAYDKKTGSTPGNGMFSGAESKRFQRIQPDADGLLRLQRSH